MKTRPKKSNAIYIITILIFFCIISFSLYNITRVNRTEAQVSDALQPEDVSLSTPENEPGEEDQVAFNKPQEKLPVVKVSVGRTVIHVEVADNEYRKWKGLSWRENLGENEGMYFVYESAVIPAFWMYGMQFPLDFIWINEDKVVEVSENIQPPGKAEETPVTLSPGTKVTGVIEVNAGFVKRNNIKTGDTVRVHR
jgi:uncharacterized protein